MPGIHLRNFEIVGNEPPKAGACHKACKVCFPRGTDVMNPSSEEGSSGDARSSDTEGSVEDGTFAEGRNKHFQCARMLERNS